MPNAAVVAGRAGVRRRQSGACARLLPSRRDGRRIATSRRAPNALRVLLAELERLYNHLHYLGHLAPHDDAQGRRGRRESLLEERAKQLNARLTGSRFLRSLLIPGGLRRDLDPQAWLGDALESLRAEFDGYTSIGWRTPTAISIA